MTEAPKLSVVIPVYDEGENICATLESLQKNANLPYEILVVYDFDEDSTVPVLKRKGQQYGPLRLVKNDVKRGPSGAIRTGLRHAAGANILVIMADGCDDLSQIPQILGLVAEGADLVCPSRYCPGGYQELEARFKLWLPRTAGWLLHVVAGMPTFDATNSFKLYTAEMLQRLRLSSTVSFSVTLEIVVKAHCLGYRFGEIPTVWRDREHGTSKFKVGRSILAYTPWFCVAFMRNRLFRLPQRLLTRWLSFEPGPTSAARPS